MTTMTPPPVTPPVSPSEDPIDGLIPPPGPWWRRLAVASAIVVVVGALGYSWHFGLLRPVPDCCGSGSASTHIGRSNEPGAVTLTGYFFNSSARAVEVVAASADLPGARVKAIAPFLDERGFEVPPENLGAFPIDVEGRSSVWFAITFVPERCDGDDDDWGTLRLDLEVAGDHWYPTFGRTFELVDPLVPAGAGQLSILPPASLDGAFEQAQRPLAAACILLDR